MDVPVNVLVDVLVDVVQEEVVGWFGEGALLGLSNVIPCVTNCSTGTCTCAWCTCTFTSGAGTFSFGSCASGWSSIVQVPPCIFPQLIKLWSIFPILSLLVANLEAFLLQLRCTTPWQLLQTWKKSTSQQWRWMWKRILLWTSRTVPSTSSEEDTQVWRPDVAYTKEDGFPPKEAASSHIPRLLFRHVEDTRIRGGRYEHWLMFSRLRHTIFTSLVSSPSDQDTLYL